MSLTNALLVRWGLPPATGYTWVVDQPSIDTYGRREAYLSSSAMSEAEAERIATALLVDRAVPQVSTQATLEPEAADAPYVDFVVGDWVTAPALGGGTESVRVVSLTVTTDDEGNPVFVPELGTVAEERDRANQRALKRMANGSLGGTTESSSTARSPLPTRRKLPTAPIGPFSIPGAVIVAVSGRYYPPTNVLALRLIASVAVAGSTDTTVVLYRNDISVATVTIAAGDLLASVVVDVTYGVGDYATVASTAAGTDAVGLVVQVPTA